MASKIKVDQIQTGDGTGTIALQNQLSGMTHASVPTLTGGHMPAGCVLQVIHASVNTQVTSTAIDTWVSSGCKATITPTSATSKILVIGNIVSQVLGSVTEKQQNHGVKRAGTLIFGALLYDEIRLQAPSGTFLGVRVPINVLDSPNTTSAIEYDLVGSLRAGTTLYMHMSNRHASTLTLMEIAG